jgi:hypothetical protein
MNNNYWTFANIWNESLLEREEKEIQSRNYIWASELGKAPIDIIYKMRGVKPTNPPNPRSLRKFEAGNIWEWIVKLILTRAGILQAKQKSASYQYDGLLKVYGRLDFIAGGKPDFEKAKHELSELILPEVFLRGATKIVDYLSKNYPNGLGSKILEIKSVSSLMFDSYEAKKVASRNHRLQLGHYIVSENMERGDVVYVSKDDCRMLEVPVYRNEIEKDYKAEIEKITKYYNSNELPPKENPIIFDEDLKKFSKNWNVAYSMYLTELYGFKDQKEFDDKYTPIVERWNRVLGRIIEGKDMTENNKDALKEIQDFGFNLDEILSIIRGR